MHLIGVKMTFKVKGTFGIDATQGVAALKTVKAAKDDVTGASGALQSAEAAVVAETQKLVLVSSNAETELQGMGNAAGAAAPKLRLVSDAERSIAREAITAGQSSEIAAGQVGNLFSQFQDVGVVLQAGQSPFVLAVQQGSQISQVLGPLGAAGAVKALKAALLQLVSPINLITIGGLAAGASLFYWLTNADEKAQTFEDSLSDLVGKMKDYEAAAKASETSTADLEAKFGAAAEQIAALRERMAESAKRELKDQVTLSFGVAFDDAPFDADNLKRFTEQTQTDLANFFNADIFRGKGKRDRRAILADVFSAYQDLQGVAKKSTDEQIAALEGLIVTFDRAAAISNKVEAAENAKLQTYEQLLEKLYELKALEDGRNHADERAARGILDELAAQQALSDAERQYGADSAEVHNLRLEQSREAFQAKLDELQINEDLSQSILDQWNLLNQGRDPYQERVASANAYYAQTLAIANAAEDEARKTLADIERQNALRQAEISFGRESLEAATLRQEQERIVFEQQLETLEVSESLKDEMRQAFEHSQNLALLDLAGGVEGAADEAQRLAEWMGISLESAIKISQFGPQGVPSEDGAPSNYRGDPREFGGSFEDWQNREAIVFLENYKPPRKGRGGRGGKSDYQREREAIAELLEREQQRIDLLKETDAVQKEMIRNRDALKNATDAERAAVEALVKERLEEEKAAEQAKERADFYEGLKEDAFSALRQKGDAAKRAWLSVAEAIAQAVIQAALFDKGPLAGFGGGGGGGAFAGALGGFLTDTVLPVFGFADGGMIFGDGGGTEDKVPIWGSPGEFMVNAKATQKHRPLLQAINDGALIPANAQYLAEGGEVGAGRSASGATILAPDKQKIVLVIRPSPIFDAHVEERATTAAQDVVIEYDRSGAGTRVEETLNNPWVKG